MNLTTYFYANPVSNETEDNQLRQLTDKVNFFVITKKNKEVYEFFARDYRAAEAACGMFREGVGTRELLAAAIKYGPVWVQNRTTGKTLDIAFETKNDSTNSMIIKIGKKSFPVKLF